MQETWVQTLSQEDLLEKGMAIHSSILAWEIPWTEEPGKLQSIGLQRVRHYWATNTFTFFLFFFFFLTLQYCIGFAIHWHESAMGVHEFPTLNSPPTLYNLSGSSQCTSPKHPVSCIEPRLAIRFLHDSIHVSMPFSQIIPPSPFPSESKSLLSKELGTHLYPLIAMQ